jgi:hypothetical protein
VNILSYLYDPWKRRWKEVIQSILKIEILTRHLPLSHLSLKTWLLPRPIQSRMCLDCGNYYQIPLYSCSVVGCDCL